MSEVWALIVFAAIVGVVLAVGIWVGMLIAPRLGRLTDSDEPEQVTTEGPGDD